MFDPNAAQHWLNASTPLPPPHPDTDPDAFEHVPYRQGITAEPKTGTGPRYWQQYARGRWVWVEAQEPGDRCPDCGGEVVEDRGKWIVTKCGECGEVFSELDYPGADLDEQMVRY